MAAEEAEAVAAAEVAADAAADVAAAVDAAETPDTAAAISSTPYRGKSGPALAIEDKGTSNIPAVTSSTKRF